MGLGVLYLYVLDPVAFWGAHISLSQRSMTQLSMHLSLTALGWASSPLVTRAREERFLSLKAHWWFGFNLRPVSENDHDLTFDFYLHTPAIKSSLTSGNLKPKPLSKSLKCWVVFLESNHYLASFALSCAVWVTQKKAPLSSSLWKCI